MGQYTAFPIDYAQPTSDDIPEGVTQLYMTSAEKVALALLDPNRQLPGGGATGQRLTKASGTDYDVEWTDDPVIDVGVTSFNTRTGDVVGLANDYNTTLITHDPTGSSLTGLTSKAAFDEVAGRLDALPRAGHVIQDDGVNQTQRTNLDFKGSFFTVSDSPPSDSTTVTFNDSGLMTTVVYDPTGVADDAFDLGNHTGSITLAQVSDSGALAALDTVSTSDIDDNAVTMAKLAATGAVPGPYQWPTVTVNSKGFITAVSENVDPLARANHTGTQLMSTISDAAAIATSGSADDLSDGVVQVAMLLTERSKLGQLDPNAQLPLGGAANHVLTKNTSSNYDVSWQPAAGGGSGHVIKDQTQTFPQRTNLTFLGFSVVDDAPGDSTNVVAPTGEALEYYGAFGIEDVNLPETVNLLPGQQWVEFVPSTAPTYDATARNVSPGSNNGRLAIDFGVAIPQIDGFLLAAVTVELSSTNMTVEIGFMEDGVIVADNIITQSISTQAVVLGGVGIPITFFVPLSDEVTEGKEYSIAFRRTTGTGNIDVTSFYMVLQGAEAGGAAVGTGDMLKSVYDTNDNAIVDQAGAQCFEGFNNTGSTILRGALVTGNGWNNAENKPNIGLADKDVADDFAVGMVKADILPGTSGVVMFNGIFENFNTTGTINLQVYYLGNAGLVTFTEPTTGTVQPIGYVLKENAADGVVVVEDPFGSIELNETYLLSRNARLKGDAQTQGHNWIIEDDTLTQRAFLGIGPGIVPTLEATGNSNLQLTAGGTLNLSGDETIVASADAIQLDNTGVGQSLDLNTINNREINVGAYFNVNPSTTLNIVSAPVSQDAEFRLTRGSDSPFGVNAFYSVYSQAGVRQLSLGSFTDALLRELRFNGNASILNETDAEAIILNNYRFTLFQGGTTFNMPTLDGSNGHVLTTNGAGDLTFEAVPGGGGGEANTGANVGGGAGLIFRDKTGVTLNLRSIQSSNATVNVGVVGDTVDLTVPAAGPGDPRVGNFTSVGGAVAVDLANIETAYVDCQQGTVTVTFSNGISGKNYTVVFQDSVGSLVLTPGVNTSFGTDITQYPTLGAVGQFHPFVVHYYAAGTEYWVVAFARGYQA